MNNKHSTISRTFNYTTCYIRITVLVDATSNTYHIESNHTYKDNYFDNTHIKLPALNSEVIINDMTFQMIKYIMMDDKCLINISKTQDPLLYRQQLMWSIKKLDIDWLPEDNVYF